MAILEFAVSNYGVLESVEEVTVEVVRHGVTNTTVRFR
jgi:hypothetical protein